LRREIAWDDVARNLAPFLATRIIYAGAGKVGSEERNIESNYQLSQRADFFSVLQSVDTLHNRPLVNTRDEPHGDTRRFRRLHVIAGDANMSEYATALRVGATTLVGALIESGWCNPAVLRDPVRAIKQISRDNSYKWIIDSEDGPISAIDVQRAFLRGCREMQLPGSDWVLDEWEETLNALESDPLSLGDKLDWVAKKLLLDEFVEAEELDWKRDVETLQSLDLAYHNVDPEAGLYYGLVQAGAMQTLVSEDEIEAARCEPPRHTRALLRGLIVRRFAPQIKAVSWGGFVWDDNGTRARILLPEADVDYAALAAQIENAATLHDVAATMGKA